MRCQLFHKAHRYHIYIERLIDWLIDGFINLPTDWLIKWLNYREIDWLIDLMIKWFFNFVSTSTKFRSRVLLKYNKKLQSALSEMLIRFVHRLYPLFRQLLIHQDPMEFRPGLRVSVAINDDRLVVAPDLTSFRLSYTNVNVEMYFCRLEMNPIRTRPLAFLVGWKKNK